MIEVEMQGGVGKLTADSINMAYMDHGWTYVTLTDFVARRNVTGQFGFVYFCWLATGLRA